MNATDKLWARGLQHMHGWHDATEHEATAQTANECGSENPFIEYIRAGLHQSALAARDRKIERLQARLDAGPSVADMYVCKGLAVAAGVERIAGAIQNIIDRMERAANGK